MHNHIIYNKVINLYHCYILKMYLEIVLVRAATLSAEQRCGFSSSWTDV